MIPAKAMGGVMPAEPAAEAIRGSVWDAWRGDDPFVAAWANARSALAAVLRGRRRAWLPAYVCEAVAQAAAAAGAEIGWYPVGFSLEPDLASLEHGITAGDAVVIVDYFGRADPAWRGLVAVRPDVRFIEDRAQALDTGAAPLAETATYSPRKLLGVGDGGIAVSRHPLPTPTEAADDRLWEPHDARAADREGLAPAQWRGLFLAAEAGMRPTGAAITDRTVAALRGTAVQPIADRRRSNWRLLAAALADWALWRDAEPEFAPLAFPIVADDASVAAAALAEARIWAPRHWAELPAGTERFDEAHRLAEACVSLPLDQRYGPEDMERIVDTVRERVRPYRR